MTKERTQSKHIDWKKENCIWIHRHDLNMLRNLDYNALKVYVHKTLLVNGILPTQQYKSVVQRINKVVYFGMKKYIPRHRIQLVDSIIKDYFMSESL